MVVVQEYVEMIVITMDREWQDGTFVSKKLLTKCRVSFMFL